MYEAARIKTSRISKELLTLEKGKLHHGIECKMKNESGVQFMEVVLPGPKDTTYQSEKFHLIINFDDLYPCSAPKLKLLTPIYHPNIDKDGRICLNTLNMPPEGAYNPTLSLESILLSIQLLISNPNPHDPLRSDAATDYILHKDIFEKKAKELIALNRKVETMETKATLKRKHSGV